MEKPGGEDPIRSFVAADWYKPHFNKKLRQTYGMAKGERIGTFVLARREWTARWEAHAMSAIADGLKDFGLANLSVLRWVSHPAGLSVKWDCHVEAEGLEAEVELREMIELDASAKRPGNWFREFLMWSSEEGQTKVIAWKTLSTEDGTGGPRPDEAGFEDFLTVVFAVWGERMTDTLRVLESAARWAEEQFSGDDLAQP